MIRILWKLVSSPISIKLLSVVVGFASTVLINRALGLEVRGELTTITTYATLIQNVSNLGLAFACSPLQKKYGEERTRRALTTIIWFQLGLYLSIAAVVILLFGFGQQGAIALIAVAATVDSQIVFLCLLDNIKRRNLIVLSAAILYLFANGIILVMSLGLEAVIFAMVAKYLVELLICANASNLFVFDLRSISFGFLKETLRYGMPTALLGLMISFNYNIDVVLMNALGSDDVQLGIFGVAIQLSNLMWFIPDAFKEYVYYKSAKEDAAKTTLCLVAINMVICCAVCLGFAFLGELFLSVMFGEEYRIAFLPTLVVFFGIIPMVAFKLIHPIYVNEGKSLVVVALLFVSIVSNAIAGILVIPSFGALGASAATVVSYSVCGALFLLRFKSDYSLSLRKLPGDLHSMFKQFVA